MGYYSGFGGSPAIGSSVPGAYAQIKSAVDSDPDWSIAANDVTDGTHIWSVFQRNSSIGTFYVTIGGNNPLGSGSTPQTLAVIAHEEYDTSTHEFSKVCIRHTAAASSDDSLPGTFTFGTLRASNLYAASINNTSTSGNKNIGAWKMALLPNGFWIANLHSSTPMEQVVLVEYMNSTVRNASTNDPKPLALYRFSASHPVSGTNGNINYDVLVSRMPFANAGGGSPSWSHVYRPWNSAPLHGAGDNLSSLGNTKDKWSSSDVSFPVCRLGVSRGGAVDADTYGNIRGYSRYALAGPSAALGDTFTLDGNTYERRGSNMSGLWLRRD